MIRLYSSIPIQDKKDVFSLLLNNSKIPLSTQTLRQLPNCTGIATHTERKTLRRHTFCKKNVY